MKRWDKVNTNRNLILGTTDILAGRFFAVGATLCAVGCSEHPWFTYPLDTGSKLLQAPPSCDKHLHTAEGHRGEGDQPVCALLCVPAWRATGHPEMWATIIMGASPSLNELTLDSADWVKASSLKSVALLQSTEGLNWTKRLTLLRTMELLPIKLGQWSFPAFMSLKLQSLDWNYLNRSPGSPACHLQILGIGLHICISQFFIINQSISLFLSLSPSLTNTDTYTHSVVLFLWRTPINTSWPRIAVADSATGGIVKREERKEQSKKLPGKY